MPQHLEGSSFVPQLKDPTVPGKMAAIGRFVAGDTIRTDQFRFSEYTNKKGKRISRMLYDHNRDSDENENIAESADHFATVKRLSLELKRGKGRDTPASKN